MPQIYPLAVSSERAIKLTHCSLPKLSNWGVFPHDIPIYIYRGGGETYFPQRGCYPSTSPSSSHPIDGLVSRLNRVVVGIEDWSCWHIIFTPPPPTGRDPGTDLHVLQIDRWRERIWTRTCLREPCRHQKQIGNGLG